MNEDNLASLARLGLPSAAAARAADERPHLSKIHILYGGRRLWPAQPTGGASATVMIRDLEAVMRAVQTGTPIALAEAYVDGSIDVEGPLDALVDAAYALFLATPDPTQNHSVGNRATAATADSAEGEPVTSAVEVEARAADIALHYDHPSEFWKAWLDSRLQYTCGVFRSPSESLEDAQGRKLEYICRKLRLVDGDSLLDLGCGWGGLLLHAHQRNVINGVGLTLSKQQADYATVLAREHSRTFVVARADALTFTHTPFTKIAAVGLIEHMGERLATMFLRKVRSLLCDDGLFLNQGIAVSPAAGFLSGPSFLDRYVFPGAGLLSLDNLIAKAQSVGFDVLDVESLAEHYVVTLQNWRRRFGEKRDTLVSTTDERTVRTFELYLVGAERGFRTGALDVFQVLFAPTCRRREGCPRLRPEASS
jgi:cyclopropane-fatty-acyl-phospholipid synthase